MSPSPHDPEADSRRYKLPHEEVDCVVLAAGLSTRAKGWKMILPFGDSTVVESTVKAALSVCSRVVLVTGYRSRELAQLFSSWCNVKTVYNPEFEKGMFGSIRIGVGQVTTNRFFIALGDMPLVSPSTYRLLMEVETAEASIPQFQGRSGHPVLLAAKLAAPILESGGEATLRQILRGRAVHRVAVSDRFVLHDIDTPEDYRTMLER
jgi:molybdenum cofactor cytidylyltransferase